MEKKHKASSALSTFSQPIAEQIWAAKYRYKTQHKVIDATLNETFKRVSTGLVANEPEALKADIQAHFMTAMSDFKLIPAGRILAGRAPPGT